MSDRGSRDRQVMTLLVQLFGRDVMDRLAGAGFDAPAAMAKAGAERLAAEAGIPVAIARRVSIVVEESPGAATPARKEPAAQPPAPKSESAARTEPAPQAKAPARPEPPARSNAVEQDESDMLMEATTPPEPALREERRPARPSPRKRIEPRVAVEPIKPAAPPMPPPAEAASPAVLSQSAKTAAAAVAAAAASTVAPSPSSGSALRDTFPDEGDPFVDDVALVSWMGLSSHQPDGRLAFTVSDTILDPVEAGASASPGASRPGSPAPADASGPAGSPAAAGASGAAGRDSARPSDPGRPQAAAAVPIDTPARPAMISGSFWTFGRPADSTQPSTGRKPETQPPAASPRRRKHDGH